MALVFFAIGFILGICALEYPADWLPLTILAVVFFFLGLATIERLT